MHPDVDLVIVFRASSKTFSKQQAREDAQHAEQEYSRLVDTLHRAGIMAVGRRGERQGQLILLLRCSDRQLQHLVYRERHSDFLYGLTTTTVPNLTQEADLRALTPAERLRLIFSFVTSTAVDGGLGISQDSLEWTRIDSVMTLHDPQFNEVWIRSLAKQRVRFEQLDTIRSQFGEGVALYFAFLVSYTRSLWFVSAVGLACYFLGHAYSIVYSSLLLLWSVVFVEYWRIRERMYSVGWGSQGSFRVERRRPQFTQGITWWQRELRIMASLPVIALFAGVLFALLSGIFVIEAFVTTLYKGPGHEYISFAPTVLFIAVIPRFLGLYQKYAVSFTKWENHRHQSMYDASLTLKTFSLSAIVAYLGLALSAFVYVPFGETVMNFVQYHISNSTSTISSYVPSAVNLSASAIHEKANGGHRFFEADVGAAHSKLNRSRLQNQMFAYTVTNQVINTFLEIGLPFVMRAVESVRAGKGISLFGKRRSSFTTRSGSGTPKKKRVGFEDEKNGVAKEEREFLERVRREVALPEYDLFADYSEMVTQFGYVALWSTIWPLAPVMALLNNILELRSDAFKIVSHCRRPLPKRTDTIGPWLDCLAFLTWVAALTNSALVYLFRPANHTTPLSTAIERDHALTAAGVSGTLDERATRSTQDLLVSALLLALGASHGYLVLRAVVRHLLERVLWKGSKEEERAERLAREVKEKYLQGVEARLPAAAGAEVRAVEEPEEGADAFWGYDEGLDEIKKGVKEA
ncbi:DUF590-domain-containing protein [Artomyces pyxidatus]|uniref:DUF590-domain-containing protein n=1 Tax=Artomyces pyxidatus TaxID=48021 RepID=A0ACB8SXU0_9AGAM|nr:DUF590-domain-containing protein [Artomyces pyxidatus]